MLEQYIRRNNRKGGTASLRPGTCVKRSVMFGARFKGLSLYFLYQKGNLIRIKTGLDTYLIRIQTRTPLSRYPPYDYSRLGSGTSAWICCPQLRAPTRAQMGRTARARFCITKGHTHLETSRAVLVGESVRPVPLGTKGLPNRTLLFLNFFR